LFGLQIQSSLPCMYVCMFEVTSVLVLLLCFSQRLLG
jgi:hypothetical protein